MTRPRIFGPQAEHPIAQMLPFSPWACFPVVPNAIRSLGPGGEGGKGQGCESPGGAPRPTRGRATRPRQTLGTGLGDRIRGRRDWRHTALTGWLVQASGPEGIPVRGQGNFQRRKLRYAWPGRRPGSPESSCEKGFPFACPSALHHGYVRGPPPGRAHTKDSFRPLGPRLRPGGVFDLLGFRPPWARPGPPGWASQAPSLAWQHLRKLSAAQFPPLSDLPQPWRAAAGPNRPR